MDKQDIINLFLKKKLQLDSEGLDFFHSNPSKIDIFLENLEEEAAPSIINSSFIQKTLHQQKVDIEIIKKPIYKEGRVSSQEYAQYFSNRFDKISKILTKKLSLMNLMSIGKVTQKTRKFSVIGMVKDRDEGRMEATIEDPTGSLSLCFDEKTTPDYKQIVLDEVIGVVCEQIENFKVKNVIWPDIPLRKNVAKTNKDAFCLFVSDLHMDEDGFKKDSYKKFLDWVNKANYNNFYVFVLGDVSHDKKDVNNFFGSLPVSCYKIFLKGEIDPDIDAVDLNVPNPSLIKIEDLYMLLSHGSFMEKYASMWGATPEVVMLNLLKKRHINPIFDLNAKIYEEDPFLLDIVPDIFATGHFHSPSLFNYKGVTIISTGSFVSTPAFWLVNLKTRETIRIDFA